MEEEEEGQGEGEGEEEGEEEEVKTEARSERESEEPIRKEPEHRRINRMRLKEMNVSIRLINNM